MKILRTILLIICCLVSIFFVAYANIQSNFAAEEQKRANYLAHEAGVLAELADKEAASAREAEAIVVMLRAELDECVNSK